jgi:hypothetical protein
MSLSLDLTVYTLYQPQHQLSVQLKVQRHFPLRLAVLGFERAYYFNPLLMVAILEEVRILFD